MIDYAVKQFQQYKNLGDKSFAQIEEPDFHFQPNNEANSIAIIIQHMHGNMISRWTDFLTEDGEKSWRQRDAEFESHQLTSGELLQMWNEGWELVFQVLSSMNESDLLKTVTIRKEPMTVTEAIIRQLCHYAYHVGQIVQIAKSLKGSKWENLSIEKGKSQEYNFKKFSEIEKEKHFMDEWLDKSK